MTNLRQLSLFLGLFSACSANIFAMTPISQSYFETLTQTVQCVNQCFFGNNFDIPNEIKEKPKKPIQIEEGCPTSKSQIQSLPFWNPDDILPCMYSGSYLVSNSTENHHLFYWFFRNLENKEAPLVLWINGGPGSSSMIGLFLENGPLRVDNPSSGEFNVYLNPEGSWVDVANVIYLDQPVDVGFSYGNSVDTTMEQGAQEFVTFMQHFYQTYPDMKDRDFFVTGESYGGKYIPLFGKTIIDYNLKASDEDKIPLKGLMVGDPFTAPGLQRVQMPVEGIAIDLVEGNQLAQVAALQVQCQQRLNTVSEISNDACSEILDYILDVSGQVLGYDTRIFDYDWNPKEDAVVAYLTNSGQSDVLYNAIHINESTKNPVYASSSEKVSLAYSYDQLVDYTHYYQYVLENNVAVLIYAGEFDQRDGPVTQLAWLNNIELVRNNSDFWIQPRKIYYINATTGGSQVVGGYFRTMPGFTYITVPKAGHFVPNTNLPATISILQDFTAHQTLLCHEFNSEDNCSVEKQQCKYMLDCNGNGQCISGFCQCSAGFAGADCASSYEDLIDSYTKVIESNGIRWTYFRFNQELQEGETFALSLESQYKFDIYVSTNSSVDPTQYSNDLTFKSQKRLVLSSETFPDMTEFVALVGVQAVDYPNNSFFDNQLKATFNVKHTQQ